MRLFPCILRVKFWPPSQAWAPARAGAETAGCHWRQSSWFQAITLLNNMEQQFLDHFLAKNNVFFVSRLFLCMNKLIFFGWLRWEVRKVCQHGYHLLTCNCNLDKRYHWWFQAPKKFRYRRSTDKMHFSATSKDGQLVQSLATSKQTSVFFVWVPVLWLGDAALVRLQSYLGSDLPVLLRREALRALAPHAGSWLVLGVTDETWWTNTNHFMGICNYKYVRISYVMLHLVLNHFIIGYMLCISGWRKRLGNGNVPDPCQK